MGKKKPATYTATLKRGLRKMLHSQLDALLNGSCEENGKVVPTIDAMAARAAVGFGFNIEVKTLHPAATKPIAPLPDPTVKQGPAVGLVHDG